MGLADVLIPDLLKPTPYKCATLDLTSVGYLHCVAAEATGPLHPRSFRTSPSSSCLCCSWVGLFYTLGFGFSYGRKKGLVTKSGLFKLTSYLVTLIIVKTGG